MENINEKRAREFLENPTEALVLANARGQYGLEIFRNDPRYRKVKRICEKLHRRRKLELYHDHPQTARYRAVKEGSQPQDAPRKR